MKTGKSYNPNDYLTYLTNTIFFYFQVNVLNIMLIFLHIGATTLSE